MQFHVINVNPIPTHTPFVQPPRIDRHVTLIARPIMQSLPVFSLMPHHRPQTEPVFEVIPSLAPDSEEVLACVWRVAVLGGTGAAVAGGAGVAAEEVAEGGDGRSDATDSCFDI
jgi:hypothetical protein